MAEKKTSEFDAASSVEAEDLFNISQKQPEGHYLTKRVTAGALDDKYILKSDVFLNLSLPALIIRK